MTTYDYEMLDPPAGEQAAAIRTDLAAVATLSVLDLKAMLGWAQHEQDQVVYQRCYDELQAIGDGRSPVRSVSSPRHLRIVPEAGQ